MTLDTFTKNKDFLVCVDSDGCVMDTMDIKHNLCFGPCMADEWNIRQNREAVLKRWNEVNLYTMTRGINRFQGLLMVLEEVNSNVQPVKEIEDLRTWVGHARELSNQALAKEIQQRGSGILKKALNWSEEVNLRIAQISQEDKHAFAGAEKGLAYAHRFADIAIVSSANLQAVLDEWDMLDVLKHVDIVLAQEAGTKSDCLEKLAKKGYEKDHILMIGDAPGDLNAADKNDILFYPILVGAEEASWKEFRHKAADCFFRGEFAEEYQKKVKEQFMNNLSSEKES